MTVVRQQHPVLPHDDLLPVTDGVEVRPYVHGLYRHLAACDIAVVQGGLTTSMELTAVHGRRHGHAGVHRAGAGRGAHQGAGLPPVETDGAARAAGLLTELL